MSDRSILDAIKSTENQINTVWILLSAAFVFFMQSGSALMCVGNVQKKNQQSMLIMKLYEVSVGVLGFFMIGYGIGFGEVSTFIGTNGNYYLSIGFEQLPSDNYLLFVFQVTFSIASTTMISGMMAERSKLPQQIVFSFFQQSFIYSVVVAWVWGGGWLYQRGFHDFAGGACIYLLGGTCGLVGSIMVGPRMNRFKKKQVNCNQSNNQQNPQITIAQSLNQIHNQRKIRYNNIDFYSGQANRVLESVKQKYRSSFEEWVLSLKITLGPSCPTYVVVGTFITWVCWLFFNAGTTLSLQVPRTNGPSIIMFNTMLSSSISGIIVAIFHPLIMRKYSKVNQFDVIQYCNGVFAGLVGITAGCDAVQSWGALSIGAGSGIFFIIGCLVLEKLQIDDPVDAVPSQVFAGFWGVVAVGIFDHSKGLVSNSSSKGYYFAWQICGCVVIMGWSGAISIIYFYLVKKLKLLRVHPLVEIIGLDRSYFGGLRNKDIKQIKKIFQSSIMIEQTQVKEEILQPNIAIQ
eukprot:403352522